MDVLRSQIKVYILLFMCTCLSAKDQPKSGLAKFNPGDIGPSRSSKVQQKSSSVDRKPLDPDAIWDPDQVPEQANCEDLNDPRPQPEYEMIFKQDVSAEDIYLQMCNKNPTTACCQYLVIKIKLPKCSNQSEINLDVKEQFLDLRTPQNKLGLHLPNPVDTEVDSKAVWDNDAKVLEVTLKNKREYDFMNE